MESTIKLTGKLINKVFNRIQQLKDEATNPVAQSAHHKCQEILLDEAQNFVETTKTSLKTETAFLKDKVKETLK